MSAMAKSITDRNSLRDILEPLLRFIDGLELIREGNPDDARSRFVDGLESSRAEREGNAADDAIRRFILLLELLQLLDSESLLGWNTMLVEGFV
jgi:hypothetical protein